MEPERRETWLKTAAAIVIGFGILIALGAHPATMGPVAFLSDLIIWPPDGAETGLARETRLLSAVTGGVMVGWGWLLWVLAGAGMARAPDLSRRLIGGSILAWFVVDCAASLAAGAPLNLVGNCVFLAIFLWPLRRMPNATASP